MRWTTPLLVFWLASSAAAQTVVPDSTPPASYAPLAVGNEWVYTQEAFYEYGGYDYVSDVRYVRDQAVEAITVGGTEYVAVVREEASRSVPAWFETGRDTVRFDAERSVVVHLEGGVDVPHSCPLDADFGATVVCDVGGERRPATVIRPDEYGFDLRAGGAKRFVYVGAESRRPTYVAGIGFIG